MKKSFVYYELLELFESNKDKQFTMKEIDAALNYERNHAFYQMKKLLAEGIVEKEEDYYTSIVRYLYKYKTE